MPELRDIRRPANAAVAPLSVWIFLFAISIPADLAPDASPADHPAQEEVQETPVDAPAKPLSIIARIIVPVAAIFAWVILLAIPLAPVLFLRWFYLAYRNLEQAGLRGLRYSPGSIIWAFLIPGFNVLRPYQIMQELWRASRALTDAESGGHARAPVGSLFVGDFTHLPKSNLVRAWWLLFVSASVWMASAAEGSINVFLSVAGDLSVVLAGILAIAVIRNVTRFQQMARLAAQS